VVVNDDFSRDLGVRLGVTGYRENGTDGAAVISGTGTGTDTMVNSIVDNLGTTGQITPVELPILTDRYNVNVPIAEAAGRFSLAVLERDYLVDLELTALEAEGRGEIVSTPRVIIFRRDDRTVQEGGAEPRGDAANYAGQQHHHGSARPQGQRR
jgi:type IV pilus assembly protein PilQ